MTKERAEVIAAFAIDCEGARPTRAKGKVQASVTVHKDGSRDVGCKYIEALGSCGNDKGAITAPCIHLKPRHLQ